MPLPFRFLRQPVSDTFSSMAPKAKRSARAAVAAASSVQEEAMAAEPEGVIGRRSASDTFKKLEAGRGTETQILKEWDLLVAYTNAQRTPMYKNNNVDRLYGVLQVHPFLTARIEAGQAKKVPTKVTLSKEVVRKADYNHKRAADVKVRAEGKQLAKKTED